MSVALDYISQFVVVLLLPSCEDYVTRRYTSAQVQNMLRQLQQKQRQAIDKYNQAVRQHNAKVRRAIDEYNREVRAHNARVLANRQRLESAVRRLKTPSTAPARLAVFRRSVETVHTSYSRLEAAVSTTQLDPRTEFLVDLSEREAANSVGLAGALFGTDDSAEQPEVLDHADIVDELSMVSPDLEHRWRGAVFALSPSNPDAARHFCASAREIFVRILDLRAPEDAVLQAKASAARTPDGRVTRRERISYLLARQGISVDALASFADADIDNVMELFRLFNDGTHGSAGSFSHLQLMGIRRRVENALQFLCQVSGSS